MTLLRALHSVRASEARRLNVGVQLESGEGKEKAINYIEVLLGGLGEGTVTTQKRRMDPP